MFGEEFELIDDFLGAELVDDANEGVGDSDKDKEHVFVATDQSHHDGEDEVDKIKQGESVFGDDAPGGVKVHETIIAWVKEACGEKYALGEVNFSGMDKPP